VDDAFVSAVSRSLRAMKFAVYSVLLRSKVRLASWAAATAFSTFASASRRFARAWSTWACKETGSIWARTCPFFTGEL
jgi:hypothetical protein